MVFCDDNDEATKKEGVIKERKCRDVACLLLFVSFWAGMFVVMGFANKKGDINRLLYGVDSYGFTCGNINKFKGQTFDFRRRKNVYHINPLDLLSVVNIPFSKTVCRDSCPDSRMTCDVNELPCRGEPDFTCPYAAMATGPVAGAIGGVDKSAVLWYNVLGVLLNIKDRNATSMINNLTASGIPWIQKFMAEEGVKASVDDKVNGRYYQLTSQIPGKGPCYPNWVPTDNFMNRCYPRFSTDFMNSVTKIESTAVRGSLSKEATKAFSKGFNHISEILSRDIASLKRGQNIIFAAGIGAALVLTLTWMVLMRYFAGLMAWVTIIAVNLVLIAFTLYCWVFSGKLANSAAGKAIADKLPSIMDPTAVDKEAWLIIAIIATIVTAGFFVTTMLMISRVRIAVACIQVATQAIGHMPAILFFPILPFIVEVGLIVYWIYVSAMLWTAGDLAAFCRSSGAPDLLTFNSLVSLTQPMAQTNTNSFFNSLKISKCYQNLPRDEMQLACGGDPNCYVGYAWDNKLRYAFIYHFFGLLWTNQFLVGITCVTVAGAIAHFYWARGDSANMPAMPVLMSFKNTFIFHLGSIVFGALIMAIFQAVRWILEYIDRKTKECQEGNCALQWAMCCVKCCMWCLEKIMAFINRTAYIMVGVKGTGYCVSAWRATKLIAENVVRLTVVNVVGDLLLFLGKVTIAAACGVLAFAASRLPYYNDNQKYPDTYMSSPVLVIAICVITGYAIADIFFAVYEMAIDTIMLAFCEDCQAHGGYPNFAPPLLMEVMNGNLLENNNSKKGKKATA